MPKIGFNFEVAGWDQLTGSLKGKELPPIAEEQRQALEAAAKDAMTLKSRYLRLRAETLATSRRLRQTMARGRQAESRLRAYLKAEYGATNLELIRHGIKPRRPGRRADGSAEVPWPLEGVPMPGDAAPPQADGQAAAAAAVPAVPHSPQPGAEEGPVAAAAAVAAGVDGARAQETAAREAEVAKPARTRRVRAAEIPAEPAKPAARKRPHAGARPSGRTPARGLQKRRQ